MRKGSAGASLAASAVSLRDVAYRVLQHPTVADKTFLVTIGDRFVGGLTRTRTDGRPLAVPVADCAVTLRDFVGDAGEAMAMGERTPLAVLNAPHRRAWRWRKPSPILPQRIHAIGDIKLSANWMAAVDVAGEDAARFRRRARWAWSFARPSASPSRSARLDEHAHLWGDGSCKSPCTRRCR